MCYICMKENLLEASRRARVGVKNPDREQASYIKKVLAELEENEEGKCNIGEGMIDLLREEQRTLSRVL